MTIAEKLTQIAENEQKIYDKGFSDGKSMGDDYAAGVQAEYDRFWDEFLSGISNTTALFAGEGWNAETFKPPRIRATSGSNYMFYNNGYIGDLTALGEELGIEITLSPKSAGCMFWYSRFTRIPTIDLRNASAVARCFAYCTRLVTLDKIIIKDDGTQVLDTNMFQNCTALKNLTIEGVIGRNGFDVQWSPLLSKQSIIGIINALSTTASGLTVTLSETAVNNAFETSERAADGSTSAEWLALIATRSNWTISLA